MTELKLIFKILNITSTIFKPILFYIIKFTTKTISPDYTRSVQKIFDLIHY